MGQWYWLYSETSEESRRSCCMVSTWIFWETLFAPVSRSLAAYLCEYECCLEKTCGLPWKMTYEQRLRWRRRVGASPKSVWVLYSPLLWMLLKHLSWKQLTWIWVTFFDLWNAAHCTKEQILSKYLQKLYPWPKGLLFSALQITQCDAWLFLVTDGCRLWRVRML